MATAIIVVTPMRQCSEMECGAGLQIGCRVGVRTHAETVALSDLQVQKPSNSPKPFDPEAHVELACPVCYGDLGSIDAHLVCTACARAYPIVDGIPVLIPECVESSSS